MRGTSAFHRKRIPDSFTKIHWTVLETSVGFMMTHKVVPTCWPSYGGDTKYKHSTMWEIYLLAVGIGKFVSLLCCLFGDLDLLTGGRVRLTFLTGVDLCVVDLLDLRLLLLDPLLLLLDLIDLLLLSSLLDSCLPSYWIPLLEELL